MQMREYLSKKGISAAKFCRACDLDLATFNKILKGGNTSFRIALKIVKFTDDEVSLNELAGLPRVLPKGFFKSNEK